MDLKELGRVRVAELLAGHDKPTLVVLAIVGSVLVVSAALIVEKNSRGGTGNPPRTTVSIVEGKGDRSNLPGRPEGCSAQIGPVPFSLHF